ncbi:SAM-dependent methyltransferase [Nocardia beijingensis]|uniref:SAM-dependent methyltransferase n=1 Tax=Nocardia beijingensis TaxID=95162 RepID=UPI001893A1C5|nr:SAM-dependent methyltransferase [Nocardia beijingensis]MBF6468968.1 SAM-dependent methyltransferase [Nocardia beijingensis]
MERAPRGVDPNLPNSARVYDYLLGGKDNYEVDRAVAHRMLAIAPDTRTLAWFSRQFLVRAVQSAAEAGVRQFIDLGAGIPTSPNVHEVARKTDPSARVVYVDFDPVVYAHCNALLANSEGVTVLQGDVRRPEEIIDRLRSEGLIDFGEPVAITLVGVLHFVMDDERPAEIVARLREAMAPGSYLAFTHGGDNSNSEFITRSSSDTANSSAQVVYRSPAVVESFFEGFEMLDPGVAPLQQWLGDDLPDTGLVLLGGVVRKPSDAPAD